MRTIKFRAWNGRMNKMISLEPSNYSTMFQDEGVKIMQFTGLKDKNGVEVYEGDIVKGYKCHYPVVFENGSFMWDDEFLGYNIECGYDCDKYIDKDDCQTLEVIGNIHENKDLLK